MTIEVRCPADGRLVGTVPTRSAEDVTAAVLALREHQRSWADAGPRRRARVLRAFAAWIADNAAHLADVVQAESGKARADAEVEAPVAVEAITYFARNAERFLTPDPVRRSGALTAAKHLAVAFRPHPVVGVITPWNFPLLGPTFDVAPALAAGASVLLKPSEVTPLTALELARGWREVDAPPVFSVATGGPATGEALVDAVDFIQFTGSTSTGKRVAHRAVDRMVPYSLELGGKDAAIVLADADLDRAAAGIAWGALFNAGQVCVSVERVYVEAAVHDEFVRKLTAVVSGLRQGADDRGYRADVGAMATPAQHDVVARHVREAIAAGATALTGGVPDPAGAFYPPTVLVGVDHAMACMREETFGPTIPVVAVADADEAVRLANDSAYGLSATVWTRDIARARRIASTVDAGAVNVNDVYCNLFAPGLPHAGWKSSGSGARFGGAHGVRKYCREQAVTLPRLPTPARMPYWYPYTPRKSRFVRRALALVTGTALR
ncbi:aldehyde dehydrogenase family protein [Actinokineospora soli]